MSNSSNLSLQIRTVGKGAYGAAVLYRKKDDDSLVILKEINMLDLSYTERQLALNEVTVFFILLFFTAKVVGLCLKNHSLSIFESIK